MTVTPIRPHAVTPTVPAGRMQPTPVNVETLTRRELEAAFYVADYHIYGDEILAGVDVLRLSAAASRAVTSLGVDLIRQVADLLEYADLHSDLTLRDRLMPDVTRRNAALSNARCLRRLLCRHTPALHAAHLIGSWQTAIGGTTVQAVAA